MYEICKNIPIPPSGKRPTKYHFSEMEVNDCFFVELTERARVQSLASKKSSRGKRFSVRKTTHDGVVCVGVWRVS
jgi:hypothetical protein